MGIKTEKDWVVFGIGILILWLLLFAASKHAGESAGKESFRQIGYAWDVLPCKSYEECRELLGEKFMEEHRVTCENGVCKAYVPVVVGKVRK